MTANDPGQMERTERRGLLLSVFGALFMGALGIGFALLTGSQAVLLDGLFSLIGFAVSLVAMRVATLVRRPDDERFHFGYAAYEPMLNLSKGLLMLLVSLFAAAAAVLAILAGGREVRGGTAVVYALIAAAGCFAIALAQRRAARRTASPLLEVDTKNWLIDGLVSMAVAVAFLIVVFLRDTRLDWFLPYADPTVVIALALLSAPIPLRIIHQNWKQLLGRAPDPEVQREARTRVEAALGETPGLTPHLRMLETGRMFYLQVYLVAEPGVDPGGLEQLDRIRERVRQEVARDDPAIMIDVVFTRDPGYARDSGAGADRQPSA